MSELVKRHILCLHMLNRHKTIKLRNSWSSKVTSNTDASLISIFCECVYNILKGNVPLSRKQKATLKNTRSTSYRKRSWPARRNEGSYKGAVSYRPYSLHWRARSFCSYSSRCYGRWTTREKWPWWSRGCWRPFDYLRRTWVVRSYTESTSR